MTMESIPAANEREWRGKAAIERLAEVFQQLYLRPDEAGAQAYQQIVRRGAEAAVKDLSHFLGDERDRLYQEETPAGGVLVLTLHERADFELFLQIVANRCVPREIPPTQGASILDGVINWQRIHRHREAFMQREFAAGNPLPDWQTEFRRFTADKRNYTDALIVLSVGPYSGVPAERLGLDPAEWVERSHVIRRVHECTHFVCRRLYPQKIDAVWDELVADAAGIYAAFGAFDRSMEEVFLGIAEGRYVGGRQNYTGGADPDALAETVRDALLAIEGVFRQYSGEGPYDIAMALEEQKEALWKR